MSLQVELDGENQLRITRTTRFCLNLHNISVEKSFNPPCLNLRFTCLKSAEGRRM